MRKLWMIVAVALVAAVAPVWAELTVEQAQKLLAGDGAAGDLFGVSVSLDGDTAVIGAWQDDDNGSDSGSAYVFSRSDGVWTQQAKLLPDDGATGDWFGVSVSLDGDTVVIGALQDDDNGSDSGSAYVFSRSEGVWTQQAKLLPEDGAASDGFGFSISLDGDTAVIGACDYNLGIPTRCSAYVFTGAGGGWTQEAKLNGPAGVGFGVSVSLDGDTAVIGAWQDDFPNGPGSGSAWVYTRSGGLWTEQAKLLPDDGPAGAEFGVSVSLNGNTAVIGAWFDAPSGSAYVFSRFGGLWTQEAKLLPDDGEADIFGGAVSLDDDAVVVGARGSLESRGSAYLFTRSDGVWTQQAKLVDDDGATGDEFGISVSLDGNTALIGASFDDKNGDDSGSASVFRVLSDPIDLLNALADNVRSLDLHHGTENSLTAKLDAALMSLTDLIEENDGDAVNLLSAFINQVEAQYGKKIDPADADSLIADAEKIIELLEDTE